MVQTPPGDAPQREGAGPRGAGAGGADHGDRGRAEQAPAADGRESGSDTARPDPRKAANDDQDTALASLQGESAEWIDAARSQQIIEEQLGPLGSAAGLAVGTLNLFASGVKVGGDFTTGGAREGRSRRRQAGGGPERVDPAHLADYTTGFVEPPGFDDALAVLEERHLLVLAGAPGTGRDAAALALLCRVTADSTATEPGIFELPANRVLGDQAWEAPQHNAGFVVTDTPTGGRGQERTGAERLDDAWLSRVSSQLAGAHSFMVIVTGPLQGTLASATRRGDFVVDHLGTPDPLEIVTARVLASEVTSDADALVGRLHRAGATTVLSERPVPRFAVRVAVAVIEALKAGQEDLATVLEGMRDPAEHVKEWFGQRPELSKIAFAVSTAVLENSSFLTVSDAAVDLHLALSHASHAPSTLQFRRGLAADQPWIELSAPRSLPTGGSPVARTVRFRNPLLSRAVLAYTWVEHDGLRPVLLSWLKGLVGHSDVEVRARAAAAVAILAADDFQHALYRYLLPWARAESEILRQSTALALGVVGGSPAHTARVWALLRQWAAELRTSKDRRLPRTAALAAGGQLGKAAPERGLSVLHTVLTDGGWDLLEPVALGVLQLVDAGRSEQVIDALMGWTQAQQRDADEDTVVKALVTFVFAARQPAFDESQGPAWPALLSKADRYERELPELWGRALGNETVRPFALEALREWLRVVDQDDTAFVTVLDVAAGIADRSRRDLRRIDYHLDRWARDADDPSPAAGRIVDALTEASVGAGLEAPWQT